MKKILPLVIVAIFLALAASTVPAFAPSALAQQAKNGVGTTFTTAWVYESPEDSFTNGQVTGHKWWQVNLRNNEDDTKAPVKQVSLKLDSALSFDNFNSEGLVSSGPPEYEWLYGDIPEWASAGTYIDSSSETVPVTFTPGFDASRSVDKTEFRKESTQTVTIRLTPRETVEGFHILVQAEENDMVNPVITSPTSGEGINLSPDEHSLSIEPKGLELNKEWTVTATVRVTPKVLGLQYMPYVLIGSEETVASGTTSGSTISKPVGDPEDGVGTWTWRADGDYEWYWEERLAKRVAWRSVHEITEGGPAFKVQSGESGNLVYVGFVDSLGYAQNSGDSLANTQVTGHRRWRVAYMENIKDETGEPVRGLRITLDSDITFDAVRDWGALTTKRGPPTYEWTYGDLSEDYTGHTIDANVRLDDYEGLTEFTPGFDVSRSFDKTVFTAPDTQTITVTVTPREETFDRVMICILTGIDQKAITDLVDVAIVDHSDEGYWESCSEDFYAEFRLPRSGIPVELNTPITVTATIQVTPKVPEVEYKAQVHVAPDYLNAKFDSGTVRGSSFSFTDEVGTWTVNAEGDYVWIWDATLGPSGSVTLMGQARNTRDISKGHRNTAIVISIVAVAVGLITYFLIRRRRRRAT